MIASRGRLVWTVLVFFLLWTVAGAALAAMPEPNKLTDKEIAEGWVLLFDGESLFGWKADSRADWKVAGGVISASQGEPGLLCTTSQFGDFVLKVDFRGAAAGNSGVFLRTVPNPTDVTTQCYEVNIADPGVSDFPTGSIVQRRKALVAASREWRAFELTAEGPRVLVKLDGTTINEYTDPKPLGRGLIGLQFRAGKIEFRNVKLRPLGTKSLFNGKDLSGWTSPPQSKSICSVTPEGWLNIKNGKGDLETAGQYADFTLQLEAFVNGKTLNSGVFLRSIPGEMMNGYECQIQNGTKDGDRTQPQDCGTGGIFRRQNARKVIPDDFQWFSLTIHADGNHMATWVNGYQVADWTDDRPPHENPRNGQRLKAGTIQIQGHDATTDLSFRNLRIAELPKR